MNTRAQHGPFSRSARCCGTLAVALLFGCGPNPASAPPSAGDVEVGYGEVDAEQITGSVTSVDVEDKHAATPLTFAQMLQGEPGVVLQERNGTMSIRIRGGSGSFMAGQEPLCVLDNITLPSCSALWALLPSAVRSISVLKDAGSTAVYGSRGANGVIVVRTKQGGG